MRIDMKRLLLLWLFSWSLLTSVHAENISLGVGVESIDERVTVTVENHGQNKVKLDFVTLELAGKIYQLSAVEPLLVKQKRAFSFVVTFPEHVGSYPLITKVHYYNNGQLLSMLHVAPFYYQRPALLDTKCIAESSSFHDHGFINVQTEQQGDWRLLLPTEVHISKTETSTDLQRFQVNSKKPDCA